MSRKLAFFISLLLMLNSAAQSTSSSNKIKSSRTFYSNLYFDLLEKNIPKNDLQNYILFESSFGGTQQIKELIIYNLLFVEVVASNDISCEKDHLIKDLIKEKGLLLPAQSHGLRSSLLRLLTFYIGNQILESSCRPEDFLTCSKENLIALEKQNKEVSRIIINDLEPSCSLIIEAYYKDSTFVMFLSDYYTSAYLVSQKKGVSPEMFFKHFEDSMAKISPIYKYLFLCKEDCAESNKLSSQLKLKTTVNEVFLQLLKRDANEKEKEFYQQIILNEADGLKVVYYLLLTSDEYSYY